MSMLILPKYVFLPILSEWLQILSVGMLDTALCNYELRPIYLMHINTKTMCFKVKNDSYSPVPLMTKSFVTWINLRDISLDYLDISGDLRQFDVVPFLLKNAQYVRRIQSRRCNSILSVKLLEFMKDCCSSITYFSVIQTIKFPQIRIPIILMRFNLSYCCQINIDSIAQLIRSCTALRCVSLAHCQLVDETSILLPHCLPILETLELIHCTSKIERYKIVSRLIVGCVNLSRVVVSGGRSEEECLHPSSDNRWPMLTHIDWSDSYLLMNPSLRYIISDCPLLTSLDLKNCCRIRDTSLLVVAECCPKLQSLTVGLCARYKHEHPFCHISNQGLMAVLNSCKDMSQWCIYDCSVTLDLIRSIISQSGGRLKSLLLFSEFISMNDECIADLVLHCKSSLTGLALNDLDHVSNDSLSLLTASCPLLTELTLINRRPTSTHSSPIVNLANNCTRLVKLHIVEDVVNHHANVSRSCYYMLATQCKLLEELSIRDSHEINDLSLIHFTSYCPYVTNLSLVNCLNVVGDCMQAVSRVYGRSLNSLCLVNNNKGSGFSDGMLMYTLPVWNRHITHLDLSDNVHISSKCVMRILRRCGDRLTSLNLSYCTALTSLSNTAIVLYCSHLSYLYLDYCPHVTDEAIFHILQRCTLLLRLSVKGLFGTPVGLGTAVGGVTPLFWLSDLQSLYPEVVVM